MSSPKQKSESVCGCPVLAQNPDSGWLNWVEILQGWDSSVPLARASVTTLPPCQRRSVPRKTIPPARREQSRAVTSCCCVQCVCSALLPVFLPRLRSSLVPHLFLVCPQMFSPCPSAARSWAVFVPPVLTFAPVCPSCSTNLGRRRRPPLTRFPSMSSRPTRRLQPCPCPSPCWLHR